MTTEQTTQDAARMAECGHELWSECGNCGHKSNGRLETCPKCRSNVDALAIAVTSVTDAELAEIEARTSGPGPLAGDGGLLRRFASSLRTERARREDAETRLAELREDARARR